MNKRVSVTPISMIAETLAAMIADEVAIGIINHKTTVVRIIPALIHSFKN